MLQLCGTLCAKSFIVALAALAATASFAQSSVTISGLLDLSYHSVSGNSTNATTKFDSISTSVGSATSAINLNVVEDLGGGLKAQAFYAFDPRNNINNSNAGIGRHEAYVGVSGGFGNIRLGSINTANLQANGAGAVFGTATGSGFAEIQTAAGGGVRFNNSLRYDTPTFNGFAASVTYTPGNKDALTGGAQPQVTDLGLSYNNGPLAVNFSSLQRSAVDAQAAVSVTAPASQVSSGGSVTAGTGAPGGQAAVTATAKSTFNLIGATYTIGNAKLFAGYGDGDKSGTGSVDSKLTRVGATYTMGAVTLLGSYSTLELGTDPKRKTTGLRADYALSKRTFAYAGYEAYDSGAASANKRNTAMVGVRHSF